MAESVLDKKLHTQYWQRCLKTLLPTRYIGNDSSRMTLGFFILSALDLLHDSSPTLSDVESRNFKNWILKCQHPHGGFCGSPNHRYPDGFYEDTRSGIKDIDPANLPATFFAILSLGFVGDLREIERKKCLSWLKRLQRADGSFGELITSEGNIWGGRDMRFCYVAAAIWWMLKGYDGEPNQSINVERLVNYIQSSQTYDGGISESSQHEAHAGYTFCAIAALSFLDQASNSPGKYRDQVFSQTSLSETIRWLSSRQVNYENENDEEEEEEEEEEGNINRDSYMETRPRCLSPKVPGIDFEKSTGASEFFGFNGRCNKMPDTCYTFWVTASLDLLGEDKANLVDKHGARQFLLKQTQHRIGGFGKSPGDPPDIYHSYLGLAALAMLDESGLKPLDSALCVSNKHKNRMAQMRDDAMIPVHRYWRHGYCFLIRKDDPDFENKIDPEKASITESASFETASTHF